MFLYDFFGYDDFEFFVLCFLGMNIIVVMMILFEFLVLCFLGMNIASLELGKKTYLAPNH